MEEERKVTNNGWLIIAPLKLLITESMYWYWLLILLISYVGIIINALNGDFETCFESRAFISTGITIIAPFCMELEIQNVVRNRKGELSKFVGFQSAMQLICMAYLVFSGVFIGTDFGKNKILQGVFCAITVLFSFYVYLVSKMDNHQAVMEMYSDKSYPDENTNISKMNGEANSMKYTKADDGGDIEL